MDNTKSAVFAEEKMMMKGYARYILPTMGGLLFGQLTPIVDTLCISIALGDTALSAMSTVNPVYYVLNIIACLGGIGGGVGLAKASGAGNKEKAGRVFTKTLVSLIVATLILSALFLFFMDPLLKALSATPENAPYAREYLIVLLVGSVFYVLQFAFTYILTDDNNPNLSMAGGIVAGAVNMIVDYVGMILLHGEIWVAAFGTVLGMFLGCLVFLLHLNKKDRMCRFVWRGDKRSEAGLVEIIKPGLPEAFTYVLITVQGLQANHILSTSLGTSGLGNAAIVENVEMIATILIAGISESALPIFASYYGEKNKDGINLLKRISLKLGEAALLPLVILLLACPQLMMWLFKTDDPVMISTLPFAIRITIVAQLFNMANEIFVSHLQSSDQEMKAVYARFIQGIVQIVAMVVFALFVPENSPWIANLLAYASVTMYFAFRCREFDGLTSREFQNISFSRGGEADGEAVLNWYEESKAYLASDEAEMVLDKMIRPFTDHLTREMRFLISFLVILKDDGAKGVVLRYDSKNDILGDSEDGVICDEEDEEGEEDDIYNECIRSEFNTMRRMMINFKS